MRHFRLCTNLSCSVEAAWEAVQRRTLLEHVTHPLLKFMPLALDALPERFQKDTYQMKLYLFGFLPIGHHTIRVVTLDPLQHNLYTEESGTLIKTWSHRITLHTDAEGRTMYSDALSLDAGRFTLILEGFAKVFYHYRQARWRALARTLDLMWRQADVRA